MIISGKKTRSSGVGQGRGAVLLFSLLVLSAVMIGSVGLGSLVLNLLQQTKVIDQSIVAFYAAETGIEESLYNARKTGNLPGSYALRTVPSGSTWSSVVSDTKEIVYATIPEDEFIEVNLFSPEAPTIATPIANVEIDWSDGCGGCSVLTLSMVSWIPGAPIAWAPSSETRTYDFASRPATISTGPSNKLYKVRLRAKNATLDNVTVRAYDVGSNPVALPGRIEIDVTGEFGDTRRRLLASMLHGAPLSGIFDFVVFSECSLVKGNRPISCP
ncbi:MAG: hypothetical protein U9Q03_04970 [Patescibacteria group bacterium]|nr:hypothetical protein [Patescibacteria group bacterium]